MILCIFYEETKAEMFHEIDVFLKRVWRREKDGY